MSFQIKLRILYCTFLSIVFSTAQLHSETINTSTSDSIKINYLYPNNISLTDSIVNYGKLFLKTPYHYGSTGTATFDCSGFTSYVYRNFGYNLQRCSADQAQQFDSVDRSQLKTGDLVYFGGRGRSNRVGHVGIVVSAKDGQFEFIHAAVHSGVTISSSEESYYTKRFIKANRVIGGNQLSTAMPYFAKTENPTYKNNSVDPFLGNVQKTRKTIPAEYHFVKSGETLSSIAKKYGISIDELKQNNKIKGNRLRLKQQLKIKDEESIMVIETATITADNTTETTDNSNTNKSELATNSQSSAASTSKITNTVYTVKKGETLFSISKLNNIPISELKRINSLNSGSIRPGQEILLSQTTQPIDNEITKSENSAKTSTHKVQSGESLFSISKMYNIPIEELKKINNLNSGNIRPGQELILSQVAESVNHIAVRSESTAKATTHKVKSGESLFSISKKFNVTVEELKKINNLNSGNIQPGQDIILSQATEQVNDKVLESESIAKTTTHKVKSGESLFTISKKFNVTVEELKKINNLNSGNIQPGQKISLTQVTEPTNNKTLKAGSTDKTSTHKVKSGESLFTISKKFNTTVEELKKINKLNNGRIQPGQEIILTQVAEPTNNKVLKAESTAKPATHKVKSGESLFTISKKFNISVEELKKINNLNNGKIQPGQEIRLS